MSQFISYAQNFEDVMLWRALGHIPEGFYIDVGAAWPEVHSVTKAFYDHGWTGINIEPNPHFYQQLCQARPKDINLNLAVSDKVSTAQLYLIEDTGLSTLDRTIAEQHAREGFVYQVKTVDTQPLSDICAAHCRKKAIHFLKIDTEGFEGTVLGSLDLNCIRPWIIVVESTLPLSKTETHAKWEKGLLAGHYTHVYSDGLNRFYLATEHEDLGEHFVYPPNVFDDFVSSDVAFLKALNTEKDKKLRLLQGDLAHLKEMEDSLSWKITAPLRALNSKRLLISKASSARKARRRLENPFRKTGRLRRGMKSLDVRGRGFHQLYFEGYTLNFSKAALKDDRGIGRVSREIFRALKTLSIAEGGRNVPTLHFYSSIHWCPKNLPPNTTILIHDVIPLVFPDLFHDAYIRWSLRYKAVARQADQIVTISQSSAADIASHLGYPRDKIRVIENGVTALPVAKARPKNLPPAPYFVFLGAYDHHKNLDIVLEAFADHELNDHQLVLIGENYACSQKIKRLGIRDQVHLLGYCQDDVTGYCLAHATALLFPSLYEGFGLPPFEAALLGTPSICSNRPAMTELLAQSALFADPTLAYAWRAAVIRLAEDHALQELLAVRAYNIAKGLTWQRNRDLFVELFNEIAGS
jgi:FkbM family methyltransferase